MPGELPQFYMSPCSYGIINFYERDKEIFKIVVYVHFSIPVAIISFINLDTALKHEY
jgi:hypothetical protein